MRTLLRISSVSRRLGISESCTRRLIQDGLIPSVRVGRQIRVNERTLNQWMNSGGAGGWKRDTRSSVGEDAAHSKKVT
ncbi:MAG: excisionase family DNA-binding protein [Bryobacteraceae bacterium]